MYAIRSYYAQKQQDALKAEYGLQVGEHRLIEAHLFTKTVFKGVGLGT